MAKKPINKGELGGSGTTSYGGVVSDVEYNATLNTEYGGVGLKILNRMRKSDPVIKSTLSIIKLAILQGEWFVKAASEETKDEEIKEFVEKALFERMDKDWKETLKDILTYLDFGFYVGEKVFKVEENFVWWKKLAFRAQTSIQKFQTKDKKDGVTQILSGDKVGKKDDRSPSIPMGKLLVFSNEKEGDNWRGVSILRSAYKPWFFKENLEKIDAIGFERNAVGVPIFSMPSNPTPEDVTAAEELGKNLRVNEKAYVLLPNDWELEIGSTKYEGQGIGKAINRYNRDIVSNVLAHFLDLGSGPTGSRALSVDQSEAFYKSIQAIGDYIASIWNGHAIKQLVDLNFDNVTEYPKLGVEGIEKIDVDRFSRALQTLTMSGIINADDDLEDHVRSKLKLPDKMELEEGEEKKEKPSGKKKVTEKDDEEEEETVKASEKKKKLGTVIEVVSKKEKIGWRPLTFAEDKVNVESLKRQMDFLEAEINKELPKVLSAEISGLMDDARQALQSGDPKRVQDMFVRFKTETMEFIIEKLNKAFEIGKVSVSNEMDVDAPKTSLKITNIIVTKANAIADRLTNRLLDKARLTVIQQMEQAIPVTDALNDLEGVLNEDMLTAVGLTASVTTVGGINQGRISVFDEYPDMIYGVQRSEILDDRVCNFCLSMDGRVVEADDHITKTGPFHFRCRGIWVEILREETERPDIGGIPAQLRERVGTLDEFRQIGTPMPLKDSLAEEFIEG